MDMERLDQIAQHFMKNRKSHNQREIGAVYYHGQRTARGIIELRKAIVPGDDSHDNILRAAAMFHDIGKGLEPHEQYGALIAKDALKDAVTPEELAEIIRIIAAHCDRCGENSPHDVWCKLQQDADLLDHFGTYEVWMCFQYYAHKGGGLADAADFYHTDLESFLGKHRALLNFDISRQIYDDKAAFEWQFVERLYVECQGYYYTPVKSNGGI